MLQIDSAASLLPAELLDSTLRKDPVESRDTN